MNHYNKSVYLSFKLKLFNSAIGYNFNAKILLHTKNARTKWSTLGNQLNERTANPPTLLNFMFVYIILFSVVRIIFPYP